MHVEIIGAGYSIPDDIRETVEEHIENRIEKYSAHIEKFIFSIRKIKDEDFKCSADIHYHWHVTAHIAHEERGLHACIESIFDDVSEKCRREKEKRKDYRNHHKGS